MDRHVPAAPSPRRADGRPRIAIIGAGFGGLAAATALRRRGFDFEVLEKAHAVGGVWLANTYPGAACDVPSSIYSYSFELRADWGSRFGTQAEIQRYLQDCADRYDITPRIRFNTEVVAATFVDGRWRVRTADGEEREYDVLIGATGLLSRPSIPPLEGLGDFRGPMFHSAEWDHSVPLAGRRVTVVGSGASAVQVVPEIVDEVGQLSVVQRSPHWVVNRWNYPSIGSIAPLRALARRWPGLLRAHHRAEYLWYEVRAPLIYRALDPLRAGLHAWMRLKIRLSIRDPALRAAVTPTYKAMCNRLLMSNSWYPALDRPHVTLHRSGVRAVHPDGLELEDGTRVETDVIIWCTGFTADQYLAPIDITGRGGRKLHEDWQEGPEAYLGVAVSSYPNLFLMYGPGTASNINSVIAMLEREARYIGMLVEDIARHGGWRDVRRAVQDDYNAWRARQLERTVYASGCPGWFRSRSGRLFAPWPGSHTAYAAATRTVDFDAYERGGTPPMNHGRPRQEEAAASAAQVSR